MVLADGTVVWGQITPGCWQGVLYMLAGSSCGLSALDVSCVPVSLLDSLALIPLIEYK